MWLCVKDQKKEEDYCKTEPLGKWFSLACRACKEEIYHSVQHAKACDVLHLSKRENEDKNRGRLITESRQAVGSTYRQDECLPKLLYVLWEQWISSSSCYIFSLLRLQRLDIRCEPAEQPPHLKPHLALKRGGLGWGGYLTLATLHSFNVTCICHAKLAVLHLDIGRLVQPEHRLEQLYGSNLWLYFTLLCISYKMSSCPWTDSPRHQTSLHWYQRLYFMSALR